MIIVQYLCVAIVGGMGLRILFCEERMYEINRFRISVKNEDISKTVRRRAFSYENFYPVHTRYVLERINPTVYG